jgi:hypothetical protein
MGECPPPPCSVKRLRIYTQEQQKEQEVSGLAVDFASVLGFDASTPDDAITPDDILNGLTKGIVNSWLL